MPGEARWHGRQAIVALVSVALGVLLLLAASPIVLVFVFLAGVVLGLGLGVHSVEWLNLTTKEARNAAR